MAEFLGTAILIALGNGVVANVVLNKTKGNNSGWIVICFGWAMAVFVGVFSVAKFSGAHLNPAVSICLAMVGKFPWSDVLYYSLAQIAGAFVGSVLVWLMYHPHFKSTEDAQTKLATFGTGPAIRNPFYNLLTETIATAIFLLCILLKIGPSDSLGALDAIPVAFLVLAVGLSFGGPTGYAINPARDLGPRLAHAILPISKKGSSDWSYAWVPIAGPVLGAVIAALIYIAIQ
ncbi:MIP/aquaporin family protein [Flavihumibacter fluvii]|uniref:MIP/aquaporin family protein n=1 Tax=Flavihumibacter fluvii TaxID=2838157 RepID=UPI001EFBD6D4|nr:MIP/aquaporin family protein [Flavihumibacter fluvii]ULQ51116.1 aquaporin family protein [Flavihumibacter fluvii]